MKKIILASVAALAFSTPAFAQDFAGPRIEGRIGWDRVNSDAAYDDGTEEFAGKGHEDGIAYGIELGYDAMVGNGLVVGAYGGIDLSTTEECGEVFGDDEACVEAGRNFTVGVRAGTPVTEHVLLYVKGGYSNGKIELAYDAEDDDDSFEVSETRGGFHLGAGGEVNLGGNSYGKLEYVYTNYNGFDQVDGEESAMIDTSRHQVLVGFGFRF